MGFFKVPKFASLVEQVAAYDDVWEWLVDQEDLSSFSLDLLYALWVRQVSEGMGAQVYPPTVYRAHFAREVECYVSGRTRQGGRSQSDQAVLFFDTGGFPYRVLVRQLLAVRQNNPADLGASELESLRSGHNTYAPRVQAALRGEVI